MFISPLLNSFFSIAKKRIPLFIAILGLVQFSHAHDSCKGKLGDVAYSNFAPTPVKVARENSRNFRDTETANVISKNKRLNAFHMLNPNSRFPEGAKMHAVVFDRFGFTPNDFTPAQNKLKTLSKNDGSDESITMGAEAFSPNTHLFNIESAAQWMKAILLDVQSQNKDGRPLVLYARGTLCEAAAYLAKQEPGLVSALVLENPTSGIDHARIPHWDANSFAVPTYITTGSHDPAYLKANKQMLYDLSRSISAKDGRGRVHYLDMPFAEGDVFGRNQKEVAKDLAYQEVYRFLNTHVLGKKYPDEDNTSPDRFVEIAQTESIGLRRFFGHKPRPTPQNEINAIRAGVLMWEQPVKAVASVEEAIAHIEKLKAVKEKPENGTINRPVFFISDHPNLSKISASKDLTEALGYLDVDPVNMIREAAISGKRFFEIDEDGSIRDYNPEKILSTPIEAVHTADNKNGFVFNASGWTLPVIRGTIDLEEAKKSHAYRTGRVLFVGAMDRKGKVTGPGISAEGFYFKKNFNLAAVLEKLRNMQRKGQSENATRFLDPFNIILMQRLYEADLLETYELYNAHGELIAGGINVKIDNVLSPETLFYPNKPEGQIPADAPLSQTLDGVDYAKIVITHMIDEAVRGGHKKMDSQIVSSFTILFNPKYVRTDSEFIPFIKETNAGWAEYQVKLAEARQRRLDQLNSKFAAKQPEVALLEKQIVDTEVAYSAAREKADALRIDRDVSDAEKEDPAMIAKITEARDAKKEARRLEVELAQLKARVEAMLEEFDDDNYVVLSKTEVGRLIQSSKERAERAEATLAETSFNIDRTREEYSKATAAHGADSPRVAELKTRLDKIISKAAAATQALEEARLRTKNLEEILRSRAE